MSLSSILTEQYESQKDKVKDYLDSLVPTNRIGGHTVQYSGVFNNLFVNNHMVNSAKHPKGKDALIYISPTEFLNLSAKAPYNFNIDYYIEKILSGDLIQDTPFFIVKSKTPDHRQMDITGHEGRHRANMFKWITDNIDGYENELMPVILSHDSLRWREEQDIPNFIYIRGQQSKSFLLDTEDIQILS